jgi:hypothetical protein
MTDPRADSERLSAVIADTLQDHEVTVGELADRVAERGFGLIMIMLAMPTMIPVLVPGTAAVIGALYVILAGQMLIGLRRPWLPRRAREYRLSLSIVQALQRRGIPFLRRIDRLSRPRGVVAEGLVTRAVAVIVLLLGVVLLSPLPFFNTIPALTALVLGIGLVNRDGVFVLLGIVMSAGVFAVTIFGAGALFALLDWFLALGQRR